MDNVQTVQEIPWGDGHKILFGMTQWGKTYAGIQTMGRSKLPVIYFNTNGSKVTDRFTTADGSITVQQLRRGIERGKKTNFLPSTKTAEMEKQLAAIVQMIFDMGNKDLIFAVDEVHIFRKEGLEAMRQVATRGLGKGYKGLWISQRPANVHNDLITQSTTRIFFNLEEEDQAYLRAKKINVDEMMQRIDRRKYVFSVYEAGDIKGPFSIGK